MTDSPVANLSPAPDPDAPALACGASAPPRLWPAWLISVSLAAALVLTVTPSIANRPRFFLMMGGPVIGGFLFTLWLLLLSRLRVRDRFLLFSGWVFFPLLSMRLSDSDPALRTAMLIYGVPLAVFSVTGGLTSSRRSEAAWRTAFGCLAAAWLSFTAVRNEGFDGEYYPEFAWRWSAPHESTLPLLGSRDVGGTGAQAGPESEAATFEQSGAVAEAWPRYRGVHGDGIARDTAGPLDWTVRPPQVLWKIPVGPAWSSFAWSGGRLFTQEQRREEECITCYSADSGALIWSHASSSRFTEVVSGAGPRSTPAVEGGRVFALGGRGLLTCLNAADGSPIWQKDMTQAVGARVPMWGFSGSPLVVDGRVVVHVDGEGNNGLVAVNVDSGEIEWAFASAGMNYTTVRDLELCGERCLVFCDSRGVHGLRPGTGEAFFSYRPTKWNAGPMVDPQSLGPNSLLVALGDGVGLCRLECSRTASGWQLTESWTTSRLRPSFNDSLVYNGSIYGFNQDLLCCLDATTGELRWRGRRYGFGQAVLLARAECLLIAAENGDAVLVKATGERFEELGRVPLLDGKTWNHPIVVGDRAYLRNGRTAAALLPGGQAAAVAGQLRAAVNVQ
ncbi:MAG: PQQ-binding-like beta-propeller repeat protein [Planctomycetota bacterium]